MKSLSRHLAAWVLAALPTLSFAANYSESIDGDLSNDHLAPTLLSLGLGSNLVEATFGKSATETIQDLDYFRVVVAPGYLLSRLELVSLSYGGAASFVAVEANPYITMAYNSTDPSQLLGWNHVYGFEVGRDLLQSMGITGGLGEGNYAFWLNETDTTEFRPYTLDLQVQAIPEPSAWAATLGAVAAGIALRRRYFVSASS